MGGVPNNMSSRDKFDRFFIIFFNFLIEQGDPMEQNFIIFSFQTFL